MLTKCVNPACSNRFRDMRQGRLLKVEKSASPRSEPSLSRKKTGASRSTEFFWLCGACSSAWNLAFDRMSGIVLIPVDPPGKSNEKHLVAPVPGRLDRVSVA